MYQDRMPGRYGEPWCPYCHRPAGLDCPVRDRGKRQIRYQLKRELNKEAGAYTGRRPLLCKD